MELSFIQPVLEMLAGKFGIVAQVLMIMGVARSIMKPLQLALPEIAKAIPGDKDDKFIAAILDSKAYKAIVFVLDYGLSVKLPKKDI